MEIVEAVAAAEGVETTSLGTSLFSVVNITAIRAVFFDQTVLGQQRYCTGQIHFQYRGFRVTISGDGLVTVAEPVCRDRPGRLVVSLTRGRNLSLVIGVNHLSLVSSRLADNTNWKNMICFVVQLYPRFIYFI
ncbi:HalOD1 output domain-containing protein [Halocatena marina]|uniref:HalOD1 output domain-containing protein n=1 Tax=Halocatena marina TaxID=2934937 RepID=A0ABD5YVG2_9EURY